MFPQKYIILKELGRGSHGIVYKIQIDDEILVLKQINIAHIKQNKQAAAYQEIQILKLLDHPNIIKYHSSFIENDIINIVMEYADEGDLMMYLKKFSQKNKMSEKYIWQIASQLTDAIAYLHSQDIMHRDVKPLNVFLTKNFDVKLGDMGISKVFKDSEPQQGSRVGTPLFLAPELVHNKPYDFKIDIWALGCVLYVACTQQPPFNGENLIQLGFNIINRTPIPIGQYYSQKLQKFIENLLIKEPFQRPSSQQIQQWIKTGFFNYVVPKSISTATKIISPICSLKFIDFKQMPSKIDIRVEKKPIIKNESGINYHIRPIQESKKEIYPEDFPLFDQCEIKVLKFKQADGLKIQEKKDGFETLVGQSPQNINIQAQVLNQIKFLILVIKFKTKGIVKRLNQIPITNSITFKRRSISINYQQLFSNDLEGIDGRKLEITIQIRFNKNTPQKLFFQQKLTQRQNYQEQFQQEQFCWEEFE